MFHRFESTTVVITAWSKNNNKTGSIIMPLNLKLNSVRTNHKSGSYDECHGTEINICWFFGKLHHLISSAIYLSFPLELLLPIENSFAAKM